MVEIQAREEGSVRNGEEYDRDNESITEMVQLCVDAYTVLEELQEQLAEACEEQTTWKEEIDRQNLRKLLDDLDAAQRVMMLIQEIVDPMGPPSPDDPIKE